jgi:hypothetical protein
VETILQALAVILLGWIKKDLVRVEGKIDGHINDHLRGEANRRVEFSSKPL